MHYYLMKLTVTCCDKIGHATRFEERAQFAARVEHVHEFDHLHKTQTDHSCLCVITVSEPIYEPSSNRYDILQNIFMRYIFPTLLRLKYALVFRRQFPKHLHHLEHI